MRCVASCAERGASDGQMGGASSNSRVLFSRAKAMTRSRANLWSQGGEDVSGVTARKPLVCEHVIGSTEKLGFVEVARGCREFARPLQRQLAATKT
jgi:hypothetical protein